MLWCDVSVCDGECVCVVDVCECVNCVLWMCEVWDVCGECEMG